MDNQNLNILDEVNKGANNEIDDISYEYEKSCEGRF